MKYLEESDIDNFCKVFSDEDEITVIEMRPMNKTTIRKTSIVKWKTLHAEITHAMKTGVFSRGQESELHFPNGKIIIGNHDGLFSLK